MSGARHLFAVPPQAPWPDGLRIRRERFERDHDASVTRAADQWVVWFPFASGSVTIARDELGDALNAADEYFRSPDAGAG